MYLIDLHGLIAWVGEHKALEPSHSGLEACPPLRDELFYDGQPGKAGLQSIAATRQIELPEWNESILHLCHSCAAGVAA